MEENGQNGREFRPDNERRRMAKHREEFDREYAKLMAGFEDTNRIHAQIEQTLERIDVKLKRMTVSRQENWQDVARFRRLEWAHKRSRLRMRERGR